MKCFVQGIAVCVLVVVLLFVAVVNWLHTQKSPLPPLVLRFEAKASADSQGMLICDGQSQVSFKIAASETYRPYRVQLPSLQDPISWIRIDPFMVRGTLNLRGIAIEEGEGNVLQKISQDNLDSLNPRAKITIANDEVIISRDSNDDYPVFLLKNIFPIRTATDNFPRIHTGGLMALWAAGFLTLGVLLWRMFLVLWREGRGVQCMFAGLFLLVLGARLLCLQIYGASFHHWDSWSEPWTLYLPFQDGNLSWKALFAPCNEHRIFFTRVLALGVFLVNGQWDNLVLASANGILYSLVAVGLALMLWQASERRYLGAIIILVALVTALPFAWENTVWGNQSQFYFFAGFSLLTIWLLGMHRAFTVQWWFGWTSAVCGLFTVGGGVIAVLAVAGLMLLRMVKEPAMRGRHFLTLILCGCVYGLYHLAKSPLQIVSMKAQTFDQFLASFGKTMSWPFVDSVWLWLVLWAPVVILALRRMRPRQDVLAIEWLLFALGGLCLVNALGVGVYRGRFSGGPASRYMDIASLSVLVNGMAIVLLAEKWESVVPVTRKRAGWMFLGWWGLVIYGILLVTATELTVNAADRVDQQRRARLVMIRFLQQDDMSYLLSKREFELPHPDVFSLATWLRCPGVRRILPSSVREPIPVEAGGASGFIPNGIHPRCLFDVHDRIWGSFTQYGNSATGNFQSKPLRLIRYPHLEFEVQGDMGTGFPSESLYLRLQDPETSRISRASHVMQKAGRWSSVIVRSPCSAPVIQAADMDPVCWLAFKEPREKSALSFLVSRLLQHGFLVAMLGVGVLLLTAVREWILPVFNHDIAAGLFKGGNG